jgi:hypothetical protein
MQGAATLAMPLCQVISRKYLCFFSSETLNSRYVLQKGNPIGERLAKVAVDSGMLLMACDQCAYEREIDGMLVDGATIGCFPNLYSALSGNMPDQVITL